MAPRNPRRRARLRDRLRKQRVALQGVGLVQFAGIHVGLARVTGGIDDVWQNPKGELIIVDYKATSKAGEVNLDAPWQIGYKRQMEIYQWLLRQSGFKVADTGYFVYCNGRKSEDSFEGKLEFDIKLIPYTGNSDWIENTLLEIKSCLDSEVVPDAAKDCEYCQYVKKINEL